MTQLADNNPEANLSALATLIAVFTEPAKAFDTISRRSMLWLPLVSVIGVSIILLTWYYQTVDFPWLQDKLTAAVSDPTVREKSKEYLTQKMLLTTSAISILVAVPLMFAIYAIYYLIVAKINKLDISFGKWYAFVAWAAVPSLLTFPLGAMQIMLAHNGQLEPGQLNPVSLNSLFFHIGTGLRWSSFLDSISLITVWSMVISVIGFQEWSKSSRTTSIVVVAIPYVLIYGIWAMISVMSKAA